MDITFTNNNCPNDDNNLEILPMKTENQGETKLDTYFRTQITQKNDYLESYILGRSVVGKTFSNYNIYEFTKNTDDEKIDFEASRKMKDLIFWDKNNFNKFNLITALNDAEEILNN